MYFIILHILKYKVYIRGYVYKGIKTIIYKGVKKHGTHGTKC